MNAYRHLVENFSSRQYATSVIPSLEHAFDPWQRQRIFSLASEIRPALGPTQPPVQWVPGSSLRGKARPVA
jgi:hypothetical protein